MGAIKCDTDSLENKVNANLKKGKNSLEEGANILESISIPSSFSHYSTLSRMPSTIKDNEENLNGFQKWIKDIIDKFTGADNATRSAIDRLTDDFNSFDLGNGQMTMVQEEEELNPFEQIGKSITDFWNSLWGENEDLQNTNANVSNSYETPVSLVTQISNGWNSMVQNVQDGLNTANDAIVDGWNNFTKSVSDWFNQAGEVVQNTFDKISETASSIAFKIREVTQTVVSSVVIGVGSILKGITEFVESLVDAVAILGTATWTFLVFVTDTVLYLGGAENKSWDDYIRYISTNSLTMRMWKAVMGFVSTQYVNNAWNDLFEHTAAGQYLDSHAIGIFKHDGIGSQISSGIGYVAGIVIATILTGGAAGVGAAASASSSATISTGIASVAALGKYTSESWNEDKASSWLGIEESYKNGEISQEDYEAMVQIRNLSDEEWQNVYNSYLAGEITEEQYLSMKNIREMPEDWRTVSNLGSGLAYGAASAAWEGIQWYVGGKLAGVNFSSRAVGTVANLGTDTVFNSFDTPYRAAIDSITSGQDFAKAFEEQGGWSGVLSNALIGLVASGAGEYVNFKFTKDMNKNILNDLDEIIQSRGIIDNEVLNSRLLNNLDKVFRYDNQSDNKILDVLLNKMRECLANGNEDAEGIIDSLIRLKIQYPSIKLKFKQKGSSSWNSILKRLSLNEIDMKDSSILHELSHLLFDLIKNKKLPSNIDVIFETAKQISKEGNYNIYSQNDFYGEIIEWAGNNATYMWNQKLQSLGYVSEEEFKEVLRNEISTKLHNTDIYSLFRELDFNWKEIIQFKLNKTTVDEIVEEYSFKQWEKIFEENIKIQYNSETLISDVISCVYMGELGLEKDNLLGSHSAIYFMAQEFWNKNLYTAPFDESLAEFTLLKLSNQSEYLEKIKNLFGEEFYNALEQTFKEFKNYGK